MSLISDLDMDHKQENIEVVEMKKIVSSAILLLVVASMLCGIVAAAEVSPGPAPDSDDGIPSGNQYIQPDSPGVGPAPNSGDGDPDGSGF